MIAHPMLVLLVLPFLLSAQQMYQDLPQFEEFPRRNGINRQIVDLEKAYEYEFAQNLAERRRKPTDWGVSLKRLVAEAQTFCRHPIVPITLDERLEAEKYDMEDGFAVDMRILGVDVIDGFTGEHYHTLIDKDDFIGYKHRKSLCGMRPITIKIKHSGCVSLPRGCYAETTIHTWVSHQRREIRWAVLTLNLATKHYDVHCSIVKRIFNFWPFSQLF